MLSLCPIFALDRYKKGLSMNSISDIPRRNSNSKLNTQKEEYSEVFQRDDARMILEKRKEEEIECCFRSLSLERPRTPIPTKGSGK